MSKPDEAAEREATAVADWAASPSAPRWTGETGRAFSGEAQAYFSSRLGHDFSSVRVHTDGDAARVASSIGARAFTFGNDIYFGQDGFDTSSREGRRLLAHELTHVVQQSEGRTGRGVIQRDADPAADRPNRIKKFRESLKTSDWNEAALALNGLNTADIDRQIADLDEPALRAIRDAADLVMKGWPRVVQERIEKRLKKWELTDFDRDWIKNLAMPILLYPDASISLGHRILMIAHARLESGAIPGGGKFKVPDGWNVFNIQVKAGTPNTKPVPRWEYKDKVPEADIGKIDLNAEISIESNGPTERWKKYKQRSGGVYEFKKTFVGIPQYSDMNEAVKGYLEFLKTIRKTAFTALTTPDQGAGEFAGGLVGYATGYDKNIGKKIQGFVGEMMPKLRDYAKERLAELTKNPNAQGGAGEESVLKQLDK